MPNCGTSYRLVRNQVTKIVHAVDVYSHRWYSGAVSEIIHAVYVLYNTII